MSEDETSRVHPDLLPALHIMVMALAGVPDQLRDNGASEDEAAEIQQATDLLTARLTRLL